MKKWLLLVGVGVIAVLGMIVFGTPYYTGKKIVLLQGNCPQINMRDHLEGTLISLPEHPTVSISVHCTDSFEGGAGWSGYSSENVVLRSVADPSKQVSRWALTVRKKVELSSEGGVQWFLVPFEIRDNLNPFVATFGDAVSRTEYLADNGNPDGDLSYLGLFSWSGSGPMIFHDAILIGNFVYVSDIQNRKNDEAIILYKDFLGDARTYVDLKILKNQPMQAKATGSFVVSREGNHLVASSRNER